MTEDELSRGTECRAGDRCSQRPAYVYTYYTLDRGGGGSWKSREICEFHAREADRQDSIGYRWAE